MLDNPLGIYAQPLGHYQLLRYGRRCQQPCVVDDNVSEPAYCVILMRTYTIMHALYYDTMWLIDHARLYSALLDRPLYVVETAI